MSKSVIKRIEGSRGFSLLEILIVLVFVGIILAAATRYAGKMIDEKTRQTAADAVAQEVYGVLQFINADSITASVNNKTENIINPLYQLPDDAVSEDDKVLGLKNNPVWLAHPHTGNILDKKNPVVSPYIARTFSKGIDSSVPNQTKITTSEGVYYSHSLKWSQAVWGQNSVRSYFTDSGCKGATGNIYFYHQFLSCNENPALSNSEIAISRIDFVSDKGTGSRNKTDSHPSVAIDRVDVYVSFTPVDGNPARIDQFITPLISAFRAKKIIPDTAHIYLVRRLTEGDAANSWTLLDRVTGLPAVSTTAGLATISDLPALVTDLQKKQTYGVRFSFDGKGDYLRTDGLNSADKVCWNTTTSKAGPCLTSPLQSSLILKRRDDPNTLADLQAANIISLGSYMGKDGKIQQEYYTAPRIQYVAFSNTGQIAPFYRNNDPKNPVLCSARYGCGVEGPTPDEVADRNKGAIYVPVQSCPEYIEYMMTGDKYKTEKLSPRLSASVSSIISGLRKDKDGTVIPATAGIFDHQDQNMRSLNKVKSDISINRLGGVTLQITKDPTGKYWRIAGMVATEDTTPETVSTGHLWQYYNPPWLSLVVTTWCSSIEQP
ncbi:TPA: type II secretion system protein [Salmonella enterica subsp. diarizonae serovar 60-67:z35:-]